MRSKKPNRQVARLVPKDVFHTHPLNHRKATIPSPTIAAPSIARTPRANAQRWHQKLGHIGQNILKKTAECSKGLEGINMNDLTTCETCHLSKAQRFVSRELRLTPNDPLDEIFIDTIGKTTAATDGQQYAVIITDAKSRMRWAIITKTKDQIAPLLIQWIEAQNHQYGKRVRAIFRDGGTEFFRIEDHCDHHGIRTEISASDTPEQNGVAESSNKFILRHARSMPIDAGMSTSFWPWAVQPIPLTDLLLGFNQPHVDRIDLSNLPRFGCKAYKIISPKPGKFEPRAEKDWFLGFQQNTSKNFIIYHPQQTSSQGLKWILSFTPHVTFNEDKLFGDKTELGNRQQSFTDCTIPFPIFIALANQSPPLTRNEQTASGFEREHQPPLSEGLTTESPQAEDITTEPPITEDIDIKTTSPEITISDLSSPEVSFAHPVSTECTSLLPTDTCHSPQSTSTANDIPIYGELQIPSALAQTTQLQLTYPSGEEQTQSANMDLISLQRDNSYRQEESNNIRDESDTVNNYQQLEAQAQGELHSQEMELD
ncbi:hypothetical protein K3495_g2541 [Podosphaera aphanis]|nr:hypothetical protein K3495_g2541 [Podosphaera aphanis]